MADPQKKNSSVNMKEKDPLKGISSVSMIIIVLIECVKYLWIDDCLFG